MTQNGQCHQFCNFSNLFPLKQCKMTWNSQFHPFIFTFSNLFLWKQCRITQNNQFCLFCNLSNLFPTEAVQTDSEQLILPVSQLFQSFPTEAVQNDLEQPISPIYFYIFQSFPTEVCRMTWNDQN